MQYYTKTENVEKKTEKNTQKVKLNAFKIAQLEIL